MRRKAVIVCGSRDSCYHKDPFYREQIFYSLETCRDIYHFDYVVTGGQTGIDLATKEWADAHGIDNKEYYADWQQYGPSAGAIRNKKMLDEIEPTLVLAFPGSLGTNSMKALADAVKCPVVELPLSDNRDECIPLCKPRPRQNVADHLLMTKK